MPAIDPLTLLILAVAIWYWTILLVEEDGPKNIFLKLRTWAGIAFEFDGGWSSDRFLGRVLLCKLCTSFWLSVVAYILWLLVGNEIVYLAAPFTLAGVALILALHV